MKLLKKKSPDITYFFLPQEKHIPEKVALYSGSEHLKTMETQFELQGIGNMIEKLILTATDPAIRHYYCNTFYQALSN